MAKKTTQAKNQDYFALKPSDEVGDALVEKVEDYYKYINQNGIYILWKEAYRLFYNGYFTKGEVEAYGKQGEKRKITINHFRSILDHIKVLTTNQRPVFDPRAINSDYKSQAQAKLAKGLLDYIMRQENLEEVIDGAMDYALQSGEGWVYLEWDSDQGEVVGEVIGEVGGEVEEAPEIEDEEIVDETSDEVKGNEESDDTEEDEEITPPKMKRAGNVKFSCHHPIDIIRDYHKDTTDGNLWYIIRKRVNKFELASRYPRFKDEILNLELEVNSVTSVALDDYEFKDFNDSDLLYVYIFRHDKSAVLPEGRQVEFLDDGTVIFDGDLPYDELSVYPIMPSKKKNSNFGYTAAYDLIPIQKAIDTLDSTILTNQSTFGVQNIVAQKGSGVEASHLGGGLNLIEFSGDKEPAPLKLLSTPPEIFNYKDNLIQQIETISGINSVSRGQPEASLKSGAALALVQSMAIQYNSGLQHSYTRMLEKVGTGIINMLKKYASAPRVALISGISNKAYLKQFKGADLELVDRVIVDVGNPMSKTLAGRMQIADTLMERGLVKSPEQYIQVIEIGRVEPLIEGDQLEVMRIREENEKLASGEQVQAVYTDNHWLDIREHKNVIAGPDARKETNVVQNTLAHINEHIELLRMTDPGILMILGQQPIPPAMMAPPVPNQPMENTPVQGQGGPGLNDKGSPEGAPGAEAPALPNMPEQPINPLTKQQFNPETGGL